MIKTHKGNTVIAGDLVEVVSDLTVIASSLREEFIEKGREELLVKIKEAFCDFIDNDKKDLFAKLNAEMKKSDINPGIRGELNDIEKAIDKLDALIKKVVKLEGKKDEE